MSYTLGRAMRISRAEGQSLTANAQAFHVMGVRRDTLNAMVVPCPACPGSAFARSAELDVAALIALPRNRMQVSW